MAADENSVNIITRASTNRSFPTSVSTLQRPSFTKKRVVLRELTNSKRLRSDSTQNQVENECSAEDRVKTQVSDCCRLAHGSHGCKFLYAPLMYQHLHSLEIEERRRPLPNYMEKIQKDVTSGMREILVDWLVEVAEEYKLVSDTLFLAVSYIDRFLSLHCLSRNKLQLLGVSSMLLASKLEEISPPHAEDYCYITDNSYTKEEVVQMEKQLLEFLGLELCNPTSKTFLRIFISAAQLGYTMASCSSLEFLSWFLVELSLLDYNCLRFLPSMVAASAIFVANFTIQPKKRPWDLCMQLYSGYKPCELKDCVSAVHDLQLSKTASCSQAIREKYSQQKFKCVAALLSSSEIPISYFEDDE